MNMKESIQVAAIKQAYAYLDKDPDANLPRLMDLADKLETGNAYAAQQPVQWRLQAEVGSMRMVQGMLQP